MKTFKQLETDILSNLSVDVYTYRTTISEEELIKYLKQMYLIGRVEGIKFGNSWNETSTKPQEEITRLEGLFDYISTNTLD